MGDAGPGEALPPTGKVVAPFLMPILKIAAEALRLKGAQEEHGCLPGAGFLWCNSTQKCIQPWKEECPKPQVRRKLLYRSSAAGTQGALSDEAVVRRLKGLHQESAEVDGEPLWVLGAPFLDHFVVILDYERGLLGVAKPKGATDEELGEELSGRFDYRGPKVTETSGDGSGTRHIYPGALARGSAQPKAFESHIDPSNGSSSAWATLAVVSMAVVLGAGVGVHFARKLRRRKNLSAAVEVQLSEESNLAAEEQDPIAAE
jgi:hypothetical protein